MSRLILIASSILLGACAPDVVLGIACEASSQCSAPLVCGQGRCRNECTDHRDCPLMARCLLGDDGQGVCTLDDDACDGARPCGEGLECRDGACFDACAASSCPAGGVCQGAVCERRDVDAGAAPDGGAPLRTCRSIAECETGELCASVTPSRAACRASCTVAGGVCPDADSQCVQVDNADALDGHGCTVPCDPRSGSGCAEGDRCDVVLARDSFSNFISAIECRPSGGTVAHGGPCPGPETLLCAQGTTCTTLDDGATHTCVQVCTFDGTGQACPAGSTCETFPGPPVRFGATVFGRCAPM